MNDTFNSRPILVNRDEAELLLPRATALTFPHQDQQGHMIQLWKFKSFLVASVEIQDKVRLFFENRIINPLHPQDTGFSLLERLENGPLKKWHFTYRPEKGEIWIWPWLLASGKGDPKADEALKSKGQSNIDGHKEHLTYDDLSGASKESRGIPIIRPDGTTPLKNGVTPYDHIKEVGDSQQGLKNIISGHKETLEKRSHQLTTEKKAQIQKELVEASKLLDNSEKYLRSLTPAQHKLNTIQQQLESKKISSEERSELERGLAKAKQNIPDHHKSEQYIRSLPLVHQKRYSQLLQQTKLIPIPPPVLEISQQPEDFTDRVQANKLVDSYNSSHPDAPMPEGKATGGQIGGVGNAVGIIHGLFDSLASRYETEHFFYLPSIKGELSLTKKEIDQILQELAVGIFVHDTVPFFSLHFNGDANMYPVIHPVYQNTFVGHIISLLDYYMKGFVNGGFFSYEFVKSWNSNPQLSESELMENIVDVFEHCKQHLKNKDDYLSIKEVIQYLKNSGRIEPDIEENPLLKDFSGFRSSFRIIAKQESIKKTENLFIIDGDFDVLYTISPDPVYAKELDLYKQEKGKNPPSYEALEAAYKTMCKQIKEFMPQLPGFKELFEALNLINFFCYYFNTFKKENKFPLLNRITDPNDLKCPPLFPHLPLRECYMEKLEIDSSIVQSLPPAKKAIVLNAMKEAINSDEAIHILSEAIRDLAIKLPPFGDLSKYRAASYYHDFASDFFKNLKILYRDAFEHVKKQAEEYIKTETADLERVKKKYKKEYKEEVAEFTADKTDFQNKTSGWFASLDKNYQTNIANLAISEQNLEILKKNKAEFQKVVARIEANIAKVRANPISILKDPAAFPFNVLKYSCPMSISESSLRLYSEQTKEEKNIHKRVVGGCGVRLERKPIEIVPEGYTHLDKFYAKLSKLPDNEILSLPSESEGIRPGGFFKIAFTDHPNFDEAAKNEVLAYLSPPKCTLSDELAECLFALSSNNEDLFFKHAEKVKEWRYMDANGLTPLHIAAHSGNDKILSYLIRKIPLSTLDARGYSALHYAAQMGRINAINSILSASPGLCEQAPPGGGTPLYVAVQNEQNPAVELLLRKGANPNCMTAQGMNGLMCAIHKGFERIALTLLDESNIDVLHQLDDRTTALHMAIDLKMAKVIDRLLERGADINAARWDGYTPLHLAVEQGGLERVRLLAGDHNIQLDVQLKNGRTALHLAAANDYYEIVEFLLSKKASPILVGWDKETPLITATKCGAVNSALCLVHAMKNLTFKDAKDKDISYIHWKDIQGNNALKVAATLKLYDLVFVYFNPLDSNIKATGITAAELLLLYCQAEIDPDIICAFIKKHHLESGVNNAYEAAAANGRQALTSLLSDQFPSSITVSEHTKSKYAAQFDNVHYIKLMIEMKHKDFQPLICGSIAAAHGSLRTLKVCLGVVPKGDLPKMLFAAIGPRQKAAADMIIHEMGNPNVPLNDKEQYASHLAVINNDRATVKFLMERGVRFDVQDSNKCTPFHCAIFYKRREILEFLLDPINDLPLPANLLHYAAAHGDNETFLIVFKRENQNLDALDPEKGYTPLIAAIENNNIQNMALLLKLGASAKDALGFAAKRHGPALMLLLKFQPLQEGEIGQEALHAALAQGIEKNVELLLQQGVNPLQKYKEKSALEVAQEQGQFNFVLLFQGQKQLLEQKKDLIIQALQEENSAQFFELVKELPHKQPMEFQLPNGVKFPVPLPHLIYSFVKDVNTRVKIINAYLKQNKDELHSSTPSGDTLLHIAGLKDQQLKLSDLPFNASDVLVENEEGITPLHTYAQSELLQSLEGLVTLKGKVCIEAHDFDRKNKKGETPLFYAVRSKRIDNVVYLIKQKVDVNHSSFELETPLALSIENNSLPIVKVLLEKGANINSSVDADHQSPLHLSLAKEFDEITRYLLVKGAHISQKDLGGVEPIHVAAKKGNLPIVRLLIACGANPLALNNEGKSVMHYAAESNCLPLIDFLVSCGVPLDPKTSDITPVQTASKNGSFPMVAQFARHGASFAGRDQESPNALFFATLSRNPGMLTLMTRSPLVKDNTTLTRSLMLAITIDDVGQLKILLNLVKNIDLKLSPISGESLLHLACKTGAVKCVYYLLSKGADANLAAYNGLTPFDFAVLADNVEIAETIYAVAQVNLTKKLPDGKSYFHVAAEKNNAQMVAFLACCLVSGGGVDE